MNLTVLQAVIGGISLVLASVGGAFVTGSAGASSQLNSVNTKVEVVKTTEELHYSEVIKILDRLEKKIDTIAPPTVAKTINEKK